MINIEKNKLIEVTKLAIRHELMSIALDCAEYNFEDITRQDFRFLLQGDLVEIYREVKRVATEDGCDTYNDRLKLVESLLKDMWLIA